MMMPIGPQGLAITGVTSDGRRRYDPASKDRLVEACLEPGVSLAGLALQHGVNANLLRKWVEKRRQRLGQSGQPSRARLPEPMACPCRDGTGACGAARWRARAPGCRAGVLGAAAGVDAQWGDADA